MIQIVFQGIVGSGNWSDPCQWSTACDCWDGYAGDECDAAGSYNDCIETIRQRV